MWPGVRTSETLLWPSTATTWAWPERISITAVAIPNSPSADTVCTGRRAAPIWSGTYSSKMLVPSQKSSETATKESTSFRGLIPASS
jgi:hypothetical protein